MPETYREILTTETDAEAAILADLMKALASNWIAGFEGASGAPRLVLAATERLVAGDSIRLRADAVSTVTALTTILSHRFAQAGTVRCTVAHRHTTGAGTSEVTIVRSRAGSGPVVLTTFNTTSTGYQNRSFDTDVQPGDILAIRHRPITAVNSEAANARFGVATGQVVWPTETMAGLVENPIIT